MQRKHWITLLGAALVSFLTAAAPVLPEYVRIFKSFTKEELRGIPISDVDFALEQNRMWKANLTCDLSSPIKEPVDGRGELHVGVCPDTLHAMIKFFPSRGGLAVAQWIDLKALGSPGPSSWIPSAFAEAMRKAAGGIRPLGPVCQYRSRRYKGAYVQRVAYTNGLCKNFYIRGGRVLNQEGSNFVRCSSGPFPCPQEASRRRLQ